jgi:hypothetical protein
MANRAASGPPPGPEPTTIYSYDDNNADVALELSTDEVFLSGLLLLGLVNHKISTL